MIKLNIQRFSSTNKTTHYDLSQYVSSDLPTYLVDYNSDMSKIDTGINTAQTTADTASTAATNAQTAAETAQTTANTAVTNAATAQSGVNTNAAAIGTLANLTTSDKTSLVNAVNEVKGNTTTNAGAINAINAEIAKLEPELIWSNTGNYDDPNYLFPGQTITFDESYDEFDIFFRSSTDAAGLREMRVRKGNPYDLESVAAGYMRFRGIQVANDGTYILFGDGAYSVAFGNITLANNQCIPIRIYGYKI